MPSEGLKPAEDLFEKITSVEEKMRSICDLIPISTWGFTAGVQEKLRQRRHKIVARTVGGVCRRVSEVFELLSVGNLEKDSDPKEKISMSNVNNGSRSSCVDEMDRDQQRRLLQKAFEKSQKHGYAFTASNGENFGACSDDSTVVGQNEEVSRKEEWKHLGDESGKVQPDRKKSVLVEVECEAKDVSLDILKQRELALRKLHEKLKAMKGCELFVLISHLGSSRQGKSGATLDSSAVIRLEEKRKLKRRISKIKMKQRRAEERQPNVGKEKNTKTMLDTGKSKDEIISFSKFDFIVRGNSEKKRLTTSQKKQKFTGKDYKSLIKKVEKREEKLEKLREKEPEKACEVEDSIRWSRVLNKAQGVKVKDNMQLLQKGLERKEKLKKKKKEIWSNRKAVLLREKEKKQKKRKENIQKRIDDSKKRKMKMLKKKGRLL
uniref:SURF6 domain-containing protein n=1 Tax=Angiostrongylus cantonensis TaxID=6313 RepID=A0A0K0DKB1_ANGCA